MLICLEHGDEGKRGIKYDSQSSNLNNELIVRY